MLDSLLAHVLFWLDSRLMKGGGRLSVHDYDSWITTLALLNLADDRADGLLRRWRNQLIRRRPRSRLLRMRGFFLPALTPKAILAQPELLVRAVLTKRITAPHALGLLDACLPLPVNGTRLVAYAVTARLLGEVALAARIEAMLGTDAFPLQHEGKSARCYSPLVLAWRFLASGASPLAEYCGQVRDISVPLTWHGFSNQQLWNADTHAIAADLIVHWRELHRMPLEPCAHYLLSQDAYHVDTHAIEQVWLNVLRHIQHQAGEPLLVLKPWPAGYDAALSLRYDVDRPITSGMITRRVEAQRQELGAPCASWYYFVQHSDRATQRVYLNRHWQESAIHAETNADAEQEIGLTYHSAPSSDYWQGDISCAALAHQGASYGEWLGMNLRVARPALAHPNLWLTPLHFPLEASTKDTSLTYFRGLLPQLRAVLASGGHAIIGSHPDLNPILMRRALRLVRSPRLWYATVGEAVQRVRAIRGDGHVRMVHGEHGLTLFSTQSISDVSIEIWPVGASRPTRVTHQLIAGISTALKVE